MAEKDPFKAAKKKNTAKKSTKADRNDPNRYDSPFRDDDGRDSGSSAKK